MALCELYMGVHAWGVEDPYLGYAQRWLFGGLCGLLPRRRLQPGSAARAEPVFPTRRETATEGALPAHHGGWGARATRRNSRRSLRRNSVHKCPKTAPRGPILPFVYTIAIPRPPTTQARVATVYTNAPKRRREAIFADLCTLLRHHGRSRDRAGPQVDRDSSCSAWTWGSLVP